MHNRFYKSLLSILLVTLVVPIHAQMLPPDGTTSESNKEKEKEKEPEKFIASRFRNWKLDETTGFKTSTDQDTLPLNFQNNAFPEKNETVAASFLANLGSPFQSKIFTDRIQKTNFIFGDVYDYWMTAPAQQVYYNTTTPYTNIKYITTFGNDYSQEENFKGLFTVNLNKYLNIGFDHEIIYSRGFYNHNSNRNKLSTIFGNYQSPRYEAYLTAASNYMENFENGGITDDRYITNPLLMSGGLREYESINIPVAITDAKSIYRNKHLFFNHKYHLGFERLVIKDKDSLAKDGLKDTLRTFVPVSSFIHTLYIDEGQKNYSSESTNSSFYSNAFLDSTISNDTSALLQVRNVFGLALVEGFHDWAQFGLTAFIEHDFRRYTRILADTSASVGLSVPYAMARHHLNLIWVGGELSRKTGDLLNFTVDGKICLAGEYIGDFMLNGNLESSFKLWNHKVALKAEGSITNNHPDYFLENYLSNHFRWTNDFSNEFQTSLRGRLIIPDLDIEAQACIDNLTNRIYFNTLAMPAQYLGNIQVMTLKIKDRLHAGIFNFDNSLVWQFSSNKDVLPLPDLSLYSDLYLKFKLSKVLSTHIGVDCRYNTSYFAPSYMPALGQFYNQNTVEVGNYPFMNAYGNFHLKRMRFFVMYSHVSRFFAQPNYFSAPHYPINPAIIKAGISWNFYD